MSDGHPHVLAVSRLCIFKAYQNAPGSGQLSGAGRRLNNKVQLGNSRFCHVSSLDLMSSSLCWALEQTLEIIADTARGRR